MRKWGRVLWLAGGLALGIAGTFYFRAAPPPVWAGNDRHGDYIICTGSVSFGVLPIGAGGGAVRGGGVGGGLGGGLRGGGGIGGGGAGALAAEGALTVPNPLTTMDGIWLLDYRAGKLLGTVVDRNFGKIVSWAEVDLVEEFKIPPKQNVHFMMTTGTTINGNTPLYLTEVNTGRFAIYMMLPGAGNTVRIVRYDATQFRTPAAPSNP